ncbi:MAG: rod shape-determining protein MreD [Clostridia bacterium]|nr:rod shape-determining protein MreD [Clostridia bacterium]
MNKRKRHYMLSYVLLFVALILQTTLIGELTIFGIAPSLMLILVVCFSLMNDCIPSAVFAVVAGLLLDVSGGRIIGFNALLMMYLSIGVVFVGQEFFRETPRAAAMLVAISTFAYEMIYFIFSLAIFGGAHFFYMIVRVILIECVYNAVLAIPVYFLVNKFLRIRSTHSLLD